MPLKVRFRHLFKFDFLSGNTIHVCYNWSMSNRMCFDSARCHKNPFRKGQYERFQVSEWPVWRSLNLKGKINKVISLFLHFCYFNRFCDVKQIQHNWFFKKWEVTIELNEKKLSLHLNRFTVSHLQQKQSIIFFRAVRLFQYVWK